MYEEPGLGRSVWLLEFLAPALLEAADLAARLQLGRRQAGLDPMPALVRVPPGPHPDGAVHFSHYLRLDRHVTPDEPASIEVRPGGPGDEGSVADWLREAFERGYSSGPARAAGPLDPILVDRVLAEPGRRTWVALNNGVAIGHATVLMGAYDPIQDEEAVELVDVLVADEARRHDAERSLVAAAHCFAREHDRDLIGHVVCEQDPENRERHCQQVIRSLRRRGWQPIHDYVLLET